MTRTWITGIGAVSAGGWSAAATWEAASSGRSRVQRVRRFELWGAPSSAGAPVPGTEEDNRRDHCRSLEFGISAAREAVAQAESSGAVLQLDLAFVANHGERRMPVGDQRSLVTPLESVADGIAAAVGAPRVLAGHGACASGTLAIGFAARALRSGMASAVVAGATDCLLTDYDYFQFCNLHGMTERDCPPEKASCPFDRRRDGFVMSEGAGFVVLETEEAGRRRGAEPLAVLEGFGSSQNAHHYVALPGDARGPELAMRRALDDAQLATSEVGYLNAHGTSTPDNDRCETAAVHRVFRGDAERLAISSTKSTLGHATAAAGAIETVICVEALRHQVLPPTVNLEEPDPECDLDYVPREARPVDVGHVMSNSFGFGGHNATVVLGRAA